MGRRLESFTEGGLAVEYTYNQDGIRTSKTVDNVRTDYYLNGSQVIAEVTGENRIDYRYDGNGMLIALRYNGDEYYYVTNIQGDIIGLIDGSGTSVVKYTYDAWGNQTSCTGTLANTLGQANPYRYRGYRFDTETGLYYLQSRYYDSDVGRFVNADSQINPNRLLGNNLLVYCENRAINRFDPMGQMSFRIGLYSFRYSYRDDFIYNPFIRPISSDWTLWNAFGLGLVKASSLLPDGSEFYRYFRSAEGGYYYYNYLKAFVEDKSISTVIMSFLFQLIAFVKTIGVGFYNVTSSLEEVLCVTNNWRFAINRHNVGISAQVISGSNGDFNINFSIIAIDRYSFQSGKYFMGIPDDWNGRFVQLGWAKFITSIGGMHGKLVSINNKITISFYRGLI